MRRETVEEEGEGRARGEIEEEVEEDRERGAESEEEAVEEDRREQKEIESSVMSECSLHRSAGMVVRSSLPTIATVGEFRSETGNKRRVGRFGITICMNGRKLKCRQIKENREDNAKEGERGCAWRDLSSLRHLEL